MRIRRRTAEHPFGTFTLWIGATHFLTKTLEKVRTELSLQVLAYNLKRKTAILGVKPLIETMRQARKTLAQSRFVLPSFRKTANRTDINLPALFTQVVFTQPRPEAALRATGG